MLVITLGVPAPSAWAQAPVTSADLIGTIMKASATSDRVLRREARQFPQRYKAEWTIDFVSEDMIRPTFMGTSYNSQSTRTTHLEEVGPFPWNVRERLIRAVEVIECGSLIQAFSHSCGPMRMAP
jgi:hypothetical protein